MATNYTVTVPSDTTSANGTKIAKGKSWSFRTPAPTVKTSFPNLDSPVERNALMFVEFDQRIDPASVLKTIKVTAGGRSLPVRLATADEIKTTKAVAELVQRTDKDRSVVFRAVDSSGRSENALPPNTRVNVVVATGTASAEGPQTTASPHSFPFNTYGPLRVTEHECLSGDGCAPGNAWQIGFSNDLDAALFNESQIKVEPEIKGMQTLVYGNTLRIDGNTRPRTRYRVRLDTAIRDQFGQTLQPGPVVTFNVGAAVSDWF
jgi:hypothetical protein